MVCGSYRLLGGGTLGWEGLKRTVLDCGAGLHPSPACGRGAGGEGRRWPLRWPSLR
ncbi:hypothetical protein CBM2587_B10135 [Cupriavidus taiwanensis]|uniref:Uncharacterized protein n=1 Tax=Cupriavidus taiwanensis TaxID=164546 RepID=A0A375BXR9_9BURK|nr:hypothetical protein CBM2587_B10135 [Cupriavidus taiwanensis]